MTPSLYECLGLVYSIVMPAAMVISVAATVRVVRSGMGSKAASLLVLITPLPLYLGILGTLETLLEYSRILALGGGTAPDASQIAHGTYAALMTIWAGAWLTVPGLVVLLWGMCSCAWHCDIPVPTEPQTTEGSCI